MSYSNRELVVFFVGYKLSQNNYPTSLLWSENADGRVDRDMTDTSTSNGLTDNSVPLQEQQGASTSPLTGIEAVKEAIRVSAEKFEDMFIRAYSDLSSQINITPYMVYHDFKAVMDNVFENGINWGRIVALFAFGGVICVKCVEKGVNDMVSSVVDWMTIYLDENLSPWIQSHGGWDSFAKIFGEDASRRASMDLQWRWMLVGLVLLTGVTVGVLLSRKS
ncbi:bcl-2-like protein 1 [Neosynchiropus ocellatus]